MTIPRFLYGDNDDRSVERARKCGPLQVAFVLAEETGHRYAMRLEGGTTPSDLCQCGWSGDTGWLSHARPFGFAELAARHWIPADTANMGEQLILAGVTCTLAELDVVLAGLA